MRQCAKKESEVVLASITQPLDWSAVFSREAPVEIDIGCGDGTFLVGLAAQNPERNFLGIERLLRRTRTACRKAAQMQLQNARVLRIDIHYALARLIPPGSVSACHLLFPDPWPKRRHHRRRAVAPAFVAAVHRTLARNGLFHIATDHEDYFREMNRVIAHDVLFTISNEAAAFPRSAFEQRFASQQATVQRLLLRKISPVR